MIKIRVWYESKLHFQVQHVTNEDGSTIINLLDQNRVYFTAPNNSVITMLSIGLKDKMGAEIWEGDVVEFYYKGKNERCEIIFTDGLFCLRWKDGYINKYQLNVSNYKVVGNVYEMPDWKIF